MSNTAIEPIPVSNRRAHLTPQQTRVLKSLLAEQLQLQHGRADQAAVDLDDFSSTDPPWEREAARETLVGLVDGVRELEEAIERIDSGHYGVCRTCSRPIPFERLEAIPEVQHCVGCTAAA